MVRSPRKQRTGPRTAAAEWRQLARGHGIEPGHHSLSYLIAERVANCVSARDMLCLFT